MPDERENLLNSALSSYAEPDEHLETRILANLAEHTGKPASTRRRWLPWTIALPLAACAVLFAILVLHSKHQQPTVQQAQRETQPPAQTAQQSAPPQPPSISAHSPKLQTVAVRATRPTAHKTTPLPKLDIFPTPRPLSPEEQALVHFVATAPASERDAVLAAQQKLNEPLHIAEIVIQPIAFPDKPETDPNR
jgi:flagellar motor protein MotB